MKNIVKILTALATIAGAIYIIATYGEQIVAWAKKVLNAMPKAQKVTLPLCQDVRTGKKYEGETTLAPYEVLTLQWK